MSKIARIVSICQAGIFLKSKEKHHESVLEKVKLALQKKPDLICLPECFNEGDFAYDNLDEVAETVPGPLTDKLAAIARGNSCYIISPMKTSRDNKYWNSAVVIGRQGEIVGIYDKIHPVTSSSDYTALEGEITPGREQPVFDLDFGRIGIQICFDIGFPEYWRELASKGVRIVFWPSAYNGGFPLQAYANIHQYYVVSSVRTDKSRIIDPLGRITGETDDNYNIVCQDINTDFMVCHYDFNYAVPDRITEKYPGRVKINSDNEQGKFLLEVTDNKLDIEQIKEEIGLESHDKYMERHRQVYAKMADGKNVEPQQALHGDRPMYSK